MTTARARITLAASTVLLVVVAGVWLESARSDGSADLVGAAITTTTSGSPTTAPPTVLPAVLEPAGRPGPAATSGVPTRIAIPSIGVDDVVVPVGQDPDGGMQVPGVADAGWWAAGPRPGATHGSSVIAAHVDFNGRPGVFRNLQRLEVGGEVTVTDESGASHRFRVSQRFQVAKGDLPRAELFRTGGSPVLTLITCGGSFDSADRHYADNIVIRADLVE